MLAIEQDSLRLVLVFALILSVPHGEPDLPKPLIKEYTLNYGRIPNMI